MSVAGTPRDLFGVNSLSRMLEASHADMPADAKPHLTLWDGLLKSAKKQEIKTTSLGRFG